MVNYAFPGPDPKFEPCPKPENVIAKIRAEENISMDEASWFLDWVVYRARFQLNRLLQSGKLDEVVRKPKTYGQDDLDIMNYPLDRLCVFARSIIFYGLQDLNIPCGLTDLMHPTHYIPNIQIETTEGKKSFIFDVTFRQFCNPENAILEFWGWAPGFILGDIESNHAILDKLLYDGWMELTPHTAEKYLSAFIAEARGVEHWVAGPGAKYKNSPDLLVNYMLAPGYNPKLRTRGEMAAYPLEFSGSM